MCVHVHVCMHVCVCTCVLGIALAWSSPVRLEQLAREPRSAAWLHLKHHLIQHFWVLNFGPLIYTPTLDLWTSEPRPSKVTLKPQF